MIRTPIRILLVLSAAVLVVAVSRARTGTAETKYAAAVARLQDTTADANEVVRLRAAEASVTTEAQPAEDVTPLVTRALIDAGLPSSSLRSISPASSASGRGRAPTSGLRVQSVKLTLEELTPQDLGRFLSSWRESQNIWTPSQIELHHPPTARSTTNSVGEYTVHITLTGYYLEDAA